MTDKITEQEFFNLDNGIVQDITREFIQPHIIYNQSMLVSEMERLTVIGFQWEDIENRYLTDEEIIKYHLDDIDVEGKEITADDIDDFRYDNPQEIYEWYLVSGWFLDRLKEINEPYLENRLWRVLGQNLHRSINIYWTITFKN